MRHQWVVRFELVLFYAVMIFFVHNTLLLFSAEDDHVLASLKEDYTCPICLEIVKSPKLTPRGHVFCGVCIDLCIEIRGVCPLTKEQVRKDQLFKLRLISQTAKYLKSFQDDDLEESASNAEEFQDHIFYKPGMRPYTREDFMRYCVEGFKSSIKYGCDCAIMTVVYISLTATIYLGFIFYLFHSQAFSSLNL